MRVSGVSWPYPELRAQIDAATNKVESYNNFSGWLAFGAEGIERNDPAEQEKIIKFDTLLSNCVIFHLAIDMTTVVRGMITEGRPVDPRDLATMAPTSPSGSSGSANTN